MKIRSRKACVSAAVFAALYGSSVTQSVKAADLTWDADSTAAGIQDGANNWNTTSPNWVNPSGANVTWNNATPDNAFFGTQNTSYGALNPNPNLVTVTEPITVGNITFNLGVNGPIYNISDDGGGGALTIAGNIYKPAIGGSALFSNFNGITLAAGQHTIQLHDSPGDAPAEMIFNTNLQGAGRSDHR